MVAHSRILAWRIPRTEEPGGLQSTGSQESDTTERLTLYYREFTGVGAACHTHTHTHTHTRQEGVGKRHTAWEEVRAPWRQNSS